MQKLTKEDIPVYGLGTWQMGGLKERDENNDDEADITAIRMHLDNGIKQIFTAQNYADTYTETLVGKALKGYDRSEFMVNTAVRKENSSFDDIISSTEESLKRLGVDYLDVVVHHCPMEGIDVSESVRGLNDVVKRGLAKGIAVSNYNSESMKKALVATENPILFNQVYYNLFVREIEEDGLLAFCQENNVLIQAFRPLELGELSKKGVNADFDSIAEKYNLTNAQLALSWLTSQDGVVTIATTHSKEHMQENLEATKVKLEKEDVELLRKNFPAKQMEKVWIR